MSNQLPKSIEHEIEYHLKNNDPESAKAVYDQWIMKNGKANTEKDETRTPTTQDDHTVLF